MLYFVKSHNGLPLFFLSSKNYFFFIMVHVDERGELLFFKGKMGFYNTSNRFYSHADTLS